MQEGKRRPGTPAALLTEDAAQSTADCECATLRLHLRGMADHSVICRGVKFMCVLLMVVFVVGFHFLS